MTARKVRLRVGDARQRDVGHGKVRMDNDTMQALGISAGDFVEIQGKKLTVVIAWPAYAGDEGQEMIGMDGLLRKNADAEVGEYVSVQKACVKGGESIVFALTTNVRLNVDDELISFVRRRFMDLPFVEGDMAMFFIFGKAHSLVVKRTRPCGPVKMTPMTRIEVLSEAVQKF